MIDKMDDTELSISFRQARDPRAQIGVLSDLTMTPPREIAERLQKLGLLEGTGIRPETFSSHFVAVEGAKKRGKDKERRKRRKPKFDEAEARRMYECGAHDKEIAAALGVSARAIQDWRYRIGLVRERGGKRRRKKEDTMKKNEETHAAPATCVAPPPVPVDWGELDRQEPPRKPMEVRQFLATLTELLTPSAAKGRLFINGVAVYEISGVCLRSDGNGLTVEIVTEG